MSRPRCSCGYLASDGAVCCRRCGATIGAGLSRPAHVLNVSAVSVVDPPVPQVPMPNRLVVRRAREEAALSQRPPARVRALPPPPPHMLAEQVLDGRQRNVLIAAGVVLLLASVVALQAILVALVAFATAMYLGALYFRTSLFVRSLRAPAALSVSDGEALAIWDRTLPVYTVLVPAYREPQVIERLLRSIDAMDYPRDRLDVKLLLEEDDLETYQAAVAARPGAHVEILRVPYSQPRTKPKACNHGLARARGRFVTIYDAEDRPDPLQLRRAVASFRRLDPRVVCLQAKLSYHNVTQNLITRWFTIEYDMWFSQLLPGLVARGAPLPLGGTSNHFRREALEEVGGWDPYNVTEDADLGIRLHRLGYRTQVLESTTLEEANSDFVNWVKQRSRWYKGYWQTWLVHMRSPRVLYRQLGLGGFVAFTLFVAGTPMLALLSPLFWALTAAWFLAKPEFVTALFPPYVYYAGMFSLFAGNLAVLYMTVIAARLSGRPSLVLAALLSPAYWVMMSIAAIKAMMQLVTAPSFWEKTVHGLDMPVEAKRPSRASI